MNKNKLMALGLVLVVGFAGFGIGSYVGNKNGESKKDGELQPVIAQLQSKVDEAKPYYEMKEVDKQQLELDNKKREEEIKLENEKIEQEKRDKAAEEQRRLTEGVTVFENDQVKINFKNVKNSGIEFLVENKTDETLTIQADAVSVNGVSYNDIIMSEDISPKSRGVVKAVCNIEVPQQVTTIGGQLRIINMENFNTTRANFSNVDVTK
ncbi:hypothetical protein [Clostridium perfringens]|uniref:hypothetical protein n=1 Tax=Clostridium perfringens TaxID=1502 RepID=UPI001E3EE9A8|nr:hypothetical protein [Clostridium perfringens]WVL78263.1 hypothetical protein LMS42_014975 [Clostridium perfringens]